MTGCETVSISKLKIGTKTDFDILNAQGRVLLKCGSFLTHHVVDRWIAGGFTKVLIRKPPAGSEPNLLVPYDAELLERVAQVFSQVSSSILQFASQLGEHSQAEVATIELLLDSLVSNINADCDAAIFCAQGISVDRFEIRNEKLARRCVQMSALGTATAIVMDLPFEQCQTVSLAGLFHDIALLNYLPGVEGRHDADIHRLHPLASARLLDSISTVSELTKTVVAEVHEQSDGTGFPRGLSSSSLTVMSRILNIVDAYLTLVDPDLEQTAFLPADVMTYLVFHTKSGHFDRECAGGFVRAMSIYPVGTRVELDDAHTATVLRSSLTDAICPIVRIDSPNQPIVDLRKSARCIVRPLPEVSGKHKRLPKSKLSEALWVVSPTASPDTHY